MPVSTQSIKWNIENPKNEPMISVEEATTRTGRKIRKSDRLFKQCTVVLSDIGYGTVMGLLSGHEYIEGEICAVGAGMTGGFENTKELKV